MEKRAILSGFEFYQQAPAVLRGEIEHVGAAVSLPGDTLCFHETDQCSTIALVGSGMVRVYKGSADGREVTLYHVAPGEMCLLTLQAALSGDRFAATGVTLSPVEAVAVPVEAFRGWIERYAYLRTLVFATMTRRVSELMVLVQEIAFRQLDQRLAAFLLDRLGPASGPDRLTMTHERIATDLGTAREVVSRLLKELERLGTIELARGEVRVIDRHALTRFANVRS